MMAVAVEPHVDTVIESVSVESVSDAIAEEGGERVAVEAMEMHRLAKRMDIGGNVCGAW